MEDILISLFFFASAIQGFILLFLFPPILLHKEENKPVTSGVSVIIAAHNEKKNLEKLVPLLLSQHHPDYEIIIADDRSTDGTSDFLSSFADPRLRIVRIDKVPSLYNPKKFALKEAISKSSKEILVLTDADCYPAAPNWINSMSARFTDTKEVVLGYSPYEKKTGFLNLFIRFETFLTGLQYLSFAKAGMPYMGVGRNLGYKKRLFESDGFEKIRSISGGDDDLFVGKVSTGKNTTICLSPESRVISVPEDNFLDFFRQKKRHLAVGTRYTWANKLKSGLFPISSSLLYFSFIGLIFMNVGYWPVLTIFILRTLVIIVIFALIARKLGETIKWFWFPVLDLSYLINYIIIGIPALLTRNNIKWK